MTLSADTATAVEAPTVIFLPEFHFPPSRTVVSVSGGKWSIDRAVIDMVETQQLRWWHAEGEQEIQIQGVRRKPGEYAANNSGPLSFLEQCQRGACSVM